MFRPVPARSFLQYTMDGNSTGGTFQEAFQYREILHGDCRRRQPTNNLTLTSTGGLSGLVQLACSGTPPDSSCSVTPSPATLSSGTSATSSVVVTTKQRVQTADGSHSGVKLQQRRTVLDWSPGYCLLASEREKEARTIFLRLSSLWRSRRSGAAAPVTGRHRSLSARPKGNTSLQ